MMYVFMATYVWLCTAINGYVCMAMWYINIYKLHMKGYIHVYKCPPDDSRSAVAQSRYHHRLAFVTSVLDLPVPTNQLFLAYPREVVSIRLCHH